MEALKITAGSVVSEIIDKVSFVNHLALLSEATAENDEATPGYMLDEITDISFQAPPSCQQLGEYLTRRLDKPSACVKLKVLKIMTRLIVNGHVSFRCSLRRNDSSVKMATMYHGVADPLLGTTAYELVRTKAQELLDRLYDPEAMQADEDLNVVPQNKRVTMNLGGLGSTANTKGKYEGFGSSPRTKEETVGDKMSELLDSLLNPVDETAETIQAAFTSSPGEYAPVCAPPAEKPAPRVLENIRHHTPGRAGGGWDSEEEDSSEQPSPFSLISLGSLDKIDAAIINEVVDEDSIEKQIVHEFCNNEVWPIDPSDLRQTMEKITLGNCVEAVRCICTVLQTSESSVTRLRALLIVECFLRTDLVALTLLSELLTSPLNRIEEEVQEGPLRSKAKKIRLILQRLLAG